MTTRHLDKMFAPESIAFFGASPKTGSIGCVVRENLVSAGFDGPVWLVNPKYDEIDGVTCYRDFKDVPGTPDLAVIATPPKTVPGIIDMLGKRGARAAVVISAGITAKNRIEDKMLRKAQKYGLRIIGPNCLGIMRPSIGLNAGFAHKPPLHGDLAFLSQSGAVLTSVLDWARSRGIGFSYMASMGNMADVDMGDMIDFVAQDTKTRAVLIYLEGVTDARKFLSATRAAARVKPVVIIKPGRSEAAAQAAATHTGALAGRDDVYAAAFRRAGIIRVEELEDLFDAAETLSRLKPLNAEALTIVTNGGGVGVLAVDSLVDAGGALATLSDETITRLDKHLPETWSRTNPVDIIGDAGPDRYKAAMDAVLADKSVDAVLVMNCPTALASSTEAAQAVITAVAEARKTDDNNRKPVLTCWLGDGAAEASREMFGEAGLPTYASPADAVRGFTYLTNYLRAQSALMRTPPNLPGDFTPDTGAAREAIADALKEKRDMLTEAEAKKLLLAYDIPTVKTEIAETPDDVHAVSRKFINSGEAAGGLVLKILSRDISHKSDIGGVRLGLETAAEAREAARDMMARVTSAAPETQIDGFTVQPMVRRPDAFELIIGVLEDDTFGPSILFGAGGTAVEEVGDKSIALPPLDLKLAHDLIDDTKIHKLLKGFRNHPGADMDAIALTLVKVSQMIVDMPEITGLDINPLLADDSGVIALDARVMVRETSASTDGLNPRLSIRPWPKQWACEQDLPGGNKVFIRPIRPEDEIYYDSFFARLDPEDVRLRLFSPMKRLTHEFVARLTQIDYARAMAFIALDEESSEMLGVSRLSANADYTRAEYAVITRSDLKGQGIGWALMQRLIDYARSEGIGELYGEVMAENKGMLSMCEELGFTVHNHPDDLALKHVSMDLTPLPAAGKKTKKKRA